MNQAGFAKVDITPSEPLMLAGYASRESPHTSVAHPVYVRVACLQIGRSAPVFIVGADLCGWGPRLCSTLYRRFSEEMGVARAHVMLNASHGHSTAVTEDVLPLFYSMDDTMSAATARYTNSVLDAVMIAAHRAQAAMEECVLEFCIGFAGFGVNRRRVRGGGLGNTTATDPDVPVLTAVRPDGSLKGLAFGYACHTTTQSGLALDPDYPGWASSELERTFPGIDTVFLSGCGGDINPLPRYRQGLEKAYGYQLASAVLDALGHEDLRSGCGVERFTLDERFSAAAEEIHLPLLPAEATFLDGSNPLQRRCVRVLHEHQARMRAEGRVPTEVPYAVQAWNLGGLNLIALSGEPVVDYSLSLRAKLGWSHTWVAGYCDNLVSYIPSERVLAEGGYEGFTAMLEYGWPASYAPGLQSRIEESIDKLLTD